MDCPRRRTARLGAALGLVAGLLAFGGHRHRLPYRPGASAPGAPGALGRISDEIFLTQELNAEASDFVLPEHEFLGATARLSPGGEDHLRQIAARARAGAPFPVIVQRGASGVRPGDPSAYPVHPDPALDALRREVVARALAALGVAEADRRVVVAPALAPGFDDVDIQQNVRNLQRTGRTGGLGGGGAGGGGFR
ncbi:MAG TPA: hypothetical protein VF590_13715 [Isosphaeraceae bacterium]|jgi:hypothetical protein